MKIAYFITLGIVVSLAATLIVNTALADFTEVAASVGLDTADGGVSWGDFNNDGCLDLLVNIESTAPYTRLYQSDCNLPNPSFTDETLSLAPGLSSSGPNGQSVVWGDLNNDGYLDFVRNADYIIEIYLNNGPGGVNWSQFGVSGFPSQTITAGDIPFVGNFSIGALGLLDYDLDYDLDLVTNNDWEGIIMFDNDGSGQNFTAIFPDSIGLPSFGGMSDFGAVIDYDVDGDVDILMRYEALHDIFINTGAGWFVFGDEILDASDLNKGGTTFFDFDNNGINLVQFFGVGQSQPPPVSCTG